MRDKFWQEIISNNINREDKTLSEFACKSQNAVRAKDEIFPIEDNIRPPFFHDIDRKIHSHAYSRYIVSV